MRGLCWLRRDLRLEDHTALKAALDQCQEVLVVFVFDLQLLEQLKNSLNEHQLPAADARLGFIYQGLIEIDQQLREKGSQLIVRAGLPTQEIPQLVQDYQIEKVFFNRDYEPSAKTRDLQVIASLDDYKIGVQHFKDHVIFEHNQVRRAGQELYRVFTPYKRKWLELLDQNPDILSSQNINFQNKLYPLSKMQKEISIANQAHWQKIAGLVFSPPTIQGGRQAALKRLQNFEEEGLESYDTNRDYPSREGTSLLSVALRHGNVSIRELVRLSIKRNTGGHQSWLSELIWREFYQMILDTHPHMTHKSFKPEYDLIKWQGKLEHYQAWCQGQTGYPLVDAAMRCLNETGQMPNRLRMVVGSFLCKTLLLDWRLGEKYFALRLLDYDMAANNGGWQWCSSSGCDAQPYFRIFNPYTQSEKFDAEGDFIRLWCPELRNYSAKFIHAPEQVSPLDQAIWECRIGEDYPFPIVNYKEMREKALDMYKA